jgi:hypothetical protein
MDPPKGLCYGKGTQIKLKTIHGSIQPECRETRGE